MILYRSEMKIFAALGVLTLAALLTSGCAGTPAWQALAQPAAEDKATEPADSQAQPVAQPATAPALGSGVLLSLWNEEQGRREIRLIDPATGERVPGFAPSTVGEDRMFTAPHALSPDGRILVALESHGRVSEPYAGGTASRASADVLHLIDLAHSREVTTDLPGKGWIRPLAFSSGNTHLALAYNARASDTLMLFDAERGKLIAQRTLEIRPSLIRFGQDGTALMVYGQSLGTSPGMSEPGLPRVLLLDGETLDVQWEQPLERIVSGDWCVENCAGSHERRLFARWSPAVVPSHDGRKLYIVHADAERLTTVDLDARTVHTVEIQEAKTWLERLLALTAGIAEAKAGSEGAEKAAVLSPDGTRLYVAGRTMNATRDSEGHWEVTEESLGLQVIDVETGRKIASRDSAPAYRIRITPDGKYLLLEGWGEDKQRTEVFDADRLQKVTRLIGWRVVLSRRLDGRPIVLATYRSPRGSTQLAVLDPESFEITRFWSVDTDASWVETP